MGVHEGSQLMQTLVHGDVDRLWRHDLAPRCALRILVFAGHPQREVSIGENPGQFALLRCDDAADVVCPQQLAGLSNILAGRNRDDRLLAELLQ
jgi:hypothetical protein